ncbi:acyltransferase [Staphylococcus edaphicus]|uniref:Probable poly-beta-1,6-N-acetyl-D-glucosamine export protein n=1 Tax=Staphylococcus edaphicus TaxID=1955013 RepID=A0A2C6WLW0_9STAP|nr:acyltransferase [Staphylococcus edaphicus]PHK49133.1 acyltransferase [Staphylococcus edaphicus]UQW80508.1 acyltransferase [Staphylococcus edaphicus]
MKYYDEVPIIRSVAAMLVVAIHTVNSIALSGGTFASDGLGYVNQIARLGTPIFAVISAFLLTISVVNKGFHLDYFVKSRFSKIFIPYIIWTIFYLLYRAYYLHNLEDDGNLLNYFVYGKANFHLYFILTVIQFYVLFPILHKFRKGWPIIGVYILATIANIIWIRMDPISMDSDGIERFVNDKLFIMNWISFFMLGIVYAKFYNEIRILIFKHKAILSIVIGILFIDFLLSIDLNHLQSSITISNMVYIPFFLIFLNYLYEHIKKNKTILKILTLIGNYSMGIYLVHYVAIQFVKRLPIIEDIVPQSKFMGVFILTVAVSVLIVYLIGKLPYGNYIVPIPRKKATKTTDVDKINITQNEYTSN